MRKRFGHFPSPSIRRRAPSLGQAGFFECRGVTLNPPDHSSNTAKEHVLPRVLWNQASSSRILQTSANCGNKLQALTLCRSLVILNFMMLDASCDLNDIRFVQTKFLRKCLNCQHVLLTPFFEGRWEIIVDTTALQASCGWAK